MKILIFVCGEGLGHTGRCISLANEMLEAGHAVHIGAYGYSKELVEKSGHAVSEIPQELRLSGKNGSLDIRKSIIGTMGIISPTNMGIVNKLVKEIEPDFVISDGYYLAILTAKRRKIPICMMVNQSNMQDFFRNKGFFTGIVGLAVRSFYKWVYKTIDIIYVPDFPLPFTICASNLAFPESIKEKVEFSGPLLRKRIDEVVPRAGLASPHVLCSIGGFGYRLQIFKTIVGAAKMDSDINYTLISGPDIDYALLGDVPENVNICKFIADPFPYYSSCDLVICTGGHGTITEALSFGLPVISFPDHLHSEQENNARFISENGYGMSFSYSVSSEELLNGINYLMHDDSFLSKTSELKELAKQLHGPTVIRERLENFQTSDSI